MCGIAGFINKDGAPAICQKLKRMTDAIAHRGPDAEGQLCEGSIALGHRRLSIIDLSDAGRQPMESADGSFVITFNGEIYNYKELKEELAKLGAAFTNDTDTEVIMEAYRYWGLDCLSRFNGMWAFALLDRRKRELFLSRDRFAVKPLYILNRSDIFMFASEAKAIIAAQPEENIPDLVQVHRFIGSALENLDEHSWYENIKIFPAAAYAVYSLDTNELSTKTYWAPDIEQFQDKWIKGRNPVTTFRTLFDDAVRLRLRADVEVGTCLSGGLDSSAIVGCCSKRHGVTMRTFSSRYADKSCDEGEFIDSVNRFANAKAVPVYPDDRPISFLEAFRRINANHDGPPGGASLYSQYSVFREVGKHVKVVLDGQGADELFCGYPGFLNPALRKAVKKCPRSFMIKTLQQLLCERNDIDIFGLSAEVGIQAFGLETYLDLMEKSAKKETSIRLSQEGKCAAFTKAFSDLVRDTPNLSAPYQSSDEVTQMCLDNLMVYAIPVLCHNEDSNAMDFSVEVRMPFLDYRIVEFALALDSSYKIRGVWQKWIIRKALRKYLPAKVRRRRSKMGYPAPFFRWLRESDEKEAFKQVIFSLAKRNIVPAETIEAHYNAHMSGEANMESILYRYLVLELWLQTCNFDKISGRAEGLQ